MASQSLHSSSEVQSTSVQKPLIIEDKSLGSVEFPSLGEAYGVNGVCSSNPRFGDSSQLALEGASKGTDQPGKSNSDKNEMNLDMNKSSSSLIEANMKLKGTSNPKNWRDIFPTPKPVTPQPKMKFTPPVEVNGKKTVASLSENFSEGIKECENLVVGFFVGERGSFAAVQNAVSKLWKPKKEVSIKLHGNCAFIFEFKDEEDRRNALETGSFYIAKQLFTVRPWSHLLEKTISEIKTVPIWTMIYGVPLHMWNNEGLSLIASFLGVPLFADDCTLNKNRLAYARICVEINEDFCYPESIPLLIDGKISLELPVEYQWKPPRCGNCKVFGHSVKNCTVKRSTRWTPKKDKVSRLQPSCNEVVNGAKGDEGFKTTTVPFVANESRDMRSMVLGTEVNAPIPVVTSISGSRDESEEFGPVTEIDVGGNCGTNMGASSSMTNPLSCHSGDGAEKGESSEHGEWIVAGKKNKKGSLAGVHSSVGTMDGSNALTKHGAKSDSMGAKNPSSQSTCISPAKSGVQKSHNKVVTSPAKCGVKPLTCGSGTGVLITAANNEKTQKIQSPKRNPFMVYSDFKEDSRFPINRTKEMEEKKGYTPSRVVVQRVSSAGKGFIEEPKEENDLLNDCDFEKKLQYMSLEEQILKRKQRELHRLQWNGSAGNSSKEGCSTNQPLGRGLRSQTKKRYS